MQFVAPVVEEVVVVVDHATLNRAYPEISYKQADSQPTDNNVNIVIIGHVDSGKSTLTGHLLYEMGHVNKQQMRKNEKMCEEFKKPGF